MKDFQVFVPTGGYEGVTAHRVKFVEGDLIFYDSDGELVIAYARGRWNTVFSDD